jgi:hypothetical protein
MNLAVIAAFTAAGLSLINVALSARLSSRGARDQWRREQAQPLIAKLLNLSTDAIQQWRDAAALKPKLFEAAEAGVDDERGKPLLDEIRGHWSKGQDQYLAMRDEAAQLDLLTSRAVRNASWRLVAQHRRALMNLLPDDPNTSFTQRDVHLIDRWHERLINATRQDFGIDTARHVLWDILRGPSMGSHKPIGKEDPKTTRPAVKAEHAEKLDQAAPSEEPA